MTLMVMINSALIQPPNEWALSFEAVPFKSWQGTRKRAYRAECSRKGREEKKGN